MRHKLLTTSGLLLIAPLLGGCPTTSTTVFDPRACPREKTYTREQQAEIAVALDKSPRVIQGVVIDYGKLRDQARACRGEQVKRR